MWWDWSSDTLSRKGTVYLSLLIGPSVAGMRSSGVLDLSFLNRLIYFKEHGSEILLWSCTLLMNVLVTSA